MGAETCGGCRMGKPVSHWHLKRPPSLRRKRASEGNEADGPLPWRPRRPVKACRDGGGNNRGVDVEGELVLTARGGFEVSAGPSDTR